MKENSKVMSVALSLVFVIASIGFWVWLTPRDAGAQTTYPNVYCLLTTGGGCYDCKASSGNNLDTLSLRRPDNCVSVRLLYVHVIS